MPGTPGAPGRPRGPGGPGTPSTPLVPLGPWMPLGPGSPRLPDYREQEDQLRRLALCPHPAAFTGQLWDLWAPPSPTSPLGPMGPLGPCKEKGWLRDWSLMQTLSSPTGHQVHQLPRHALEHRDKRHSGWTDGTRPSVDGGRQSRAVLVSSGRLWPHPSAGLCPRPRSAEFGSKANTKAKWSCHV